MGVERQRTEVAGKGLVFADLKTAAAHRTVTVPPKIATEIEKHLDLFVAADSEALVFTMTHSGDVPRSTSWRLVWSRATTRAGVPELRFHDLRHLAGTLSAIAGGTLKEIQARLGHASIDAAMVYQHVAKGRDVALANAIDRLLGGE